MKKMPYAIIFIVILVLLVFVGCMRFSNELPGMRSDPDSTSDETALATEYNTAQQAEEEEELVQEMLDSMRSAVNEEGQTKFSEEEISSAEVSMRAEIASSAAASNKTPANATQPTTAGTPATPTTQPNQPAQQTQQTTPATSQPAQQTQTGPNEFDIMRSGTFYCVGSMNDGENVTPLELAITPTSVYMLTKLESVDMGVMVSDGTTYFVYPQEKVYLKVSALILKMMDMDPDEMMLSASELGFTDLDPLSKASAVENGTFQGKACTVYTFPKSSGGKNLIYMDGNHLLGLETFDAAGALTSGTYITSITGNVPADKINPPADYQETSLTKFMTMLAGVM